MMRSPFAMTPWVRRLLVANAVVYLLAITVFTGPWFVMTFGFAPSGALLRPWTFVTYMFVHGGVLHLALNMLMLFFFGPAVEERMGSRAFSIYYLLAGLGGAALSFVIALFTPVSPFVGASGAVFGVALAFALHWPNTPILVFPLPFPIRAKWLVIILATLDLMLAVSGARDGVAHLAHLGGFLFGFVYWAVDARLHRGSHTHRFTASDALAPAWTPPRSSERRGRRLQGTRAERPPVDRTAEVDRLLDKISATGIDSLTPEERRTLDDLSRQFRR